MHHVRQMHRTHFRVFANTAGNPGRAAIYKLVSHDYWWPKMCHTITRYIWNYETCMQIKPARHAPYGFLKPLEVPIR